MIYACGAISNPTVPGKCILNSRVAENSVRGTIINTRYLLIRADAASVPDCIHVPPNTELPMAKRRAVKEQNRQPVQLHTRCSATGKVNIWRKVSARTVDSRQRNALQCDSSKQASAPRHQFDHVQQQRKTRCHSDNTLNPRRIDCRDSP